MTKVYHIHYGEYEDLFKKAETDDDDSPDRVQEGMFTTGTVVGTRSTLLLGCGRYKRSYRDIIQNLRSTGDVIAYK